MAVQTANVLLVPGFNATSLFLIVYEVSDEITGVAGMGIHVTPVASSFNVGGDGPAYK